MSAIHVVATSARTPLGLNGAASAAAYRAGISAAREHPYFVDVAGDAVTVAVDTLLDPALTGPQRLLALATDALQSVFGAYATQAGAPVRIPLCLALPESRPGFSAEDACAIRDGLGQWKSTAGVVGEITMSMQGHAAGLALFETAMQRIHQGVTPLCLVGGVESYLHPDTVEWLDANRQLVGARSRSAFVPGEGAGFCLLMNDEEVQRLGWQPLATVTGVAVGRESKLIRTNEICLGVGLTDVVRNVAAKTGSSQRINGIICDINGERYRGEEWSYVCLRLPQLFDDPSAYWSPADCWGDLGAAGGPAFATLAIEASMRGYANGPSTMLWASSEGGLRAAVVVETHANGQRMRGRS
jgi:3-oxoacyl-[acyl-carrier-protein] synthase I